MVPPPDFGAGGGMSSAASAADPEMALFTQSRIYHKQQQTQEDRYTTRIDALVSRSRAKVTAVDGEKKLRRFIRRFTDGFVMEGKTIEFSEFQWMFINLILPAFAANIVGKQWNAICARLSRDFGWDLKRMPRVYLAQAPRRFGKTVCLGAMMGNYSLEVPGSCLSGFSTSKRASQRLKARTKGIIDDSGYSDWIIKSNEEQIVLMDPDDPSDLPRQENFYPSNKVIEIEAIYSSAAAATAQRA